MRFVAGLVLGLVLAVAWTAVPQTALEQCQQLAEEQAGDYEAAIARLRFEVVTLEGERDLWQKRFDLASRERDSARGGRTAFQVISGALAGALAASIAR